MIIVGVGSLLLVFVSGAVVGGILTVKVARWLRRK